MIFRMIAADATLMTAPIGYVCHVYAADWKPAFIWNLPYQASLDFAGMPRAELRRAIGYRQTARRPRSTKKAPRRGC